MPHAAKADRLRQAKAEAEREIAAYRAEREGAYQKKVSEVRARTRPHTPPPQPQCRELAGPRACCPALLACLT